MSNRRFIAKFLEHTLERCSQLAVSAIQTVDWDVAAAWLVDDGVPRCTPLPSSNLVRFGRWRHARGREHCRGELGRAVSSGYAPDSARADSSSILDEPGECRTPVRENHRREPGGFWGKSWSLTTACLLSTRANKERWTGKIRGAFTGMHGALDGWMLARAPASPAQGLPSVFQFSLFLCDVWPWETWN